MNEQPSALSPQPSALSAAYYSWQQRTLTCASNATFAEGLATGSGFAMPQAILWDQLDDFVLVEDDAILQAMVWMLERAHTLAEAAGAASLAAAYQLRERLAGRSVGLVCSGGNSSLVHLRQALARDEE
jgi:threonine dehydratase